MRPRNKPPGNNALQTSDEIYNCTKSYWAMNANDPVISHQITCNLSCKNRNSDLNYSLKMLKYSKIVWITFFWPENKTPFYRFVSDPVSDQDSNPDPKCLFRIRIRPKVSDPYGSGSGSATLYFKLYFFNFLEKNVFYLVFGNWFNILYLSETKLENCSYLNF